MLCMEISSLGWCKLLILHQLHNINHSRIITHHITYINHHHMPHKERVAMEGINRISVLLLFCKKLEMCNITQAGHTNNWNEHIHWRTWIIDILYFSLLELFSIYCISKKTFFSLSLFGSYVSLSHFSYF